MSLLSQPSQDNQNLINPDPELLRLQSLSTEILQLMPIFFLFFVFYTTKNGLLSLLLYNIFLILMPFLYVKFYLKSPINTFLVPPLKSSWRQALLYGVPISVSLFCLIFGLFSSRFDYQIQYIIKFRFLFPNEKIIYVLTFPIFTIFTPFLSEIFWRILPLDTIKRPNKLRMCFYYGFFHGLIVYILKDSLSGILFFGIYAGLAWFFAFLKEKFGILTGILAHMGVNLGVSIAFILIINEQKKLA